ncbi:HlyD family secretion protein [Flagellimonas olearia]|uniref:AprE-like beta-barrel domain-containing protein n=1 Tax=Flagellimonas olearia TaxID=552546 RepID=A0A444VQN9_9FLAO|nr:HlyD family efflux transporter periplasmic adaptor subunit [Allomuricauda olearia]RYC53123.1 hypothetical protein DN53_02580 [Allomuricauda olearia]
MEANKNGMDNWDERSDQVREILGKAPNWVIRFGITLVFIIIFLLLLGASLISYNDIIPAQITVTSKNPPVYLKSKSSGRLTQIFIQPGQNVRKGEPLAEIENTATIDDVYYLKNHLKDSNLPLITLDSLKSLFPFHLKLGDVQMAYDDFIAQYQNYIVFNTLTPIKKQPDIIRRQLLGQQLGKAQQNLNNAIASWEQNYIIKSPIDGTATFFDIWSQYQHVSAGETIFTIVPDDPEEIIGHATLPARNSGKVKTGQKVMIKLDNYPFQEWGSLEGMVSSISEVPKPGEQVLYTLQIEINSLTTSYGKSIDFKPEMQGKAEVIIEELTVMERIFYQLRKTFDR